MEDEIWKLIDDYPKYKISNYGRIKSINKKFDWKLMNPENHNGGYFRASLNKKGIRKRVFVHVLVAKAFIPKIKNKDFVNHIDEIKKNNYYKNLEWCTFQENINHGTATHRRSEKLKNVGGSRKAKKVFQYSKENIFIRSYPSVQECGRLGFLPSHVSQVCNGIRKTHKGYFWYFKKQ